MKYARRVTRIARESISRKRGLCCRSCEGKLSAESVRGRARLQSCQDRTTLDSRADEAHSTKHTSLRGLAHPSVFVGNHHTLGCRTLRRFSKRGTTGDSVRRSFSAKV